MTIHEALVASTTYPVPCNVITDITEGRGIVASDVATPEVRISKSFQLALSDVKMFVAGAHDVSQGGVTISMSESERDWLRSTANELRKKWGESNSIFGYKGSRL